VVLPSREHRLHCTYNVGLAAACQVALGRKHGGYFAQRHLARLQLLGKYHDVWPSLTIRPAAPAFACSGLLAVTRGLELGDQGAIKFDLPAPEGQFALTIEADAG
jgi:hypothetical protein